MGGIGIVFGLASSDLSGASLPAPPATTAAALAPVPARAPVRVAGAASPVLLNASGAAAPMHDGQWFERVHVLPRTADLGFVLSDQTIAAEVWNAFRGRARTLTAINVTGAAGVSVDSPPALPANVPALASSVYTVRAASQGDARIDDVVSWVFTGVPIEQTDLTLLGSRLVPFPFPPDLAGGIAERVGYLTDLLEAYDGSEQRVQLRDVPVVSLEFAVLLDDPRDAQHAAALLYGWQANVFGVPFWQYANRLDADAPVGSTTLSVDTADIPWAPGDIVFLWSGPFDWEALTVLTAGTGAVTVTSPTRKSWSAATAHVMPLGVGRLPAEQDFGWEALRVGSARPAFTLEGVA